MADLSKTVTIQATQNAQLHDSLHKEMTDLNKTVLILANQNIQLQNDIINLISDASLQLARINQSNDNLMLLQAQSNLLLGFIVSEPASLKRFAVFAKTIAENEAENFKDMRVLALSLLDGELSQHLSPPLTESSSGAKNPAEAIRYLGDNIIQFPKPPSNDISE